VKIKQIQEFRTNKAPWASRVNSRFVARHGGWSDFHAFDLWMSKRLDNFPSLTDWEDMPTALKVDLYAVIAELYTRGEDQ